MGDDSTHGSKTKLAGSCAKLPAIIPSNSKYEGREIENWRKLSKAELNRLSKLEKSRYMAYEKPAESVRQAAALSQRRVMLAAKDMRMCQRTEQRRKKARLLQDQVRAEAAVERASHRLKVQRSRVMHDRVEEIEYLVSSQPTSLKAMKLQNLVPLRPQVPDLPPSCDLMEKDALRVRSLLESDVMS